MAEFEAENQRQAASRKPRTSDPNFNQEKTNLIVNYLPQVKYIFLHKTVIFWTKIVFVSKNVIFGRKYTVLAENRSILGLKSVIESVVNILTH